MTCCAEVLRLWSRWVSIVAVRNTTDRSGTTDDERWAAAEAVLDQLARPVERARLRRRWVIIWSVIGVTFVLGAALGLLLVDSADGAQNHDGALLWREVTGIGVLCAGLVVMVAGFVIGFRRGIWRDARLVRPESALTRAQRKQLSAQASGRAPVAADRIPLARHLAERVARQRHLVLMWAGMCMVQVGRLIGASDWFAVATAVPLALSFVVTMLVGRRQVQRAERFLATHPTATPGG